MPINIPTTQEIKDQNLSNLETQLGQTSPPAEKSFLKVLSVMEAIIGKALYNYGVERSKQNLALTATGEDLDNIGEEYNVIRKPAEAAILTGTLPGTNGTVIPATVAYIGDLNGARYVPESSVVISGGVATTTITAENVGVIGNLNVGDTLVIDTPVSGAESVLTVTVVDNVGAEEEEEEDFRQRILNIIRNVKGGGNANDHKIWAEEVAGVKQAYPYSGRPNGDPITSKPADRTVYIESTTDINPDGVAPPALLDEVRDSINEDPATGRTRPPLGLVDSTLFIESIIRKQLFVTVNNLTVDPGEIAVTQADVETALTSYFLEISMFVGGIDFPSERNDIITNLTVSDIVQDAIIQHGGSADSVQVGFSYGTPFNQYQLQPGELAKLGGVQFA